MNTVYLKKYFLKSVKMETRQRFFNMVNEVVLINGWQYKKNAFRSVASANFLIL